jgi:putative protease
MVARNSKPELISPAGNMECARAAVANGADAVYFGLGKFNARMRADNFTERDLPELVTFLHEHKVRAFCTFNTLVFTAELPAAEAQLRLLDDAGVDVVIVQDVGLATLARRMGLRMAVHGSTQMTITSPEGAAFAARMGIERVVLAREASMQEMARFPKDLVGLEVFVHGALCVAYSGQCLTSEAFGQRSANRGECAQACRLPYQLIVDGVLKELGDKRYLLSPQDLAAVEEIPELIRLGVTGFKIEGRLKAPEYVAATTQVYRRVIDAALSEASAEPTEAERYQLEMTFSRGLYSGWLHGVNHQELVHARFGKKRGPFVGRIDRVGPDFVEVRRECPLQAGDGVVFDIGGDTDKEQGGRVWQVVGDKLFFERGKIDFGQLKRGDRVWKTSDPRLERELRKSFQGEIPKPKEPITITVTGKAGEPMVLESDGVRVASGIVLEPARKRPLTTEYLTEQLGRLGDTEYRLEKIVNGLVGEVMVPVSEVNRLRRELVEKLGAEKWLVEPQRHGGHGGRKEGIVGQALRLPSPGIAQNDGKRDACPTDEGGPRLTVLCRTMDQIRVALEAGVETVYVDFEDIKRYGDAVAAVRNHGGAKILLATPRIQKAGEQGFFKTIASYEPDGVLVRNLGAIEYFRESPLIKVGDFSLNVANPIAAEVMMGEGLDRLTVSYDLNAQQVLDLLRGAPAGWFEITIHQHMPMFHMEHCVFAAFLTNGTDHTNCGRPCDTRNLKVRDRLGVDHPVKADVGCRNTVYHARAQSGAEYFRSFCEAGARVFRVELLEEPADTAAELIRAYRDLVRGEEDEIGPLMRRLNVATQLGVTSGTLTVLG